MRKILEHFYRGELDGVTQYIRKTQNGSVSEYKNLLHAQNESVDALFALLSDEAKAAFHTYEQTVAAVQVFEREESFVNAFRLGAKMMLEILSEEDGAFTATAE